MLGAPSSRLFAERPRRPATPALATSPVTLSKPRLGPGTAPLRRSTAVRTGGETMGETTCHEHHETGQKETTTNADKCECYEYEEVSDLHRVAILLFRSPHPLV